MKDFKNYHNLNSNNKLYQNGLLILEKSLDGFSGYDIIINNSKNTRVLIYQKWDSNSETKKVIGRIEDIERGNIFNIDGMDWLVSTFPEDNKIYRKAEIRLCNSTFPIESDKNPVLIGYDNLNRPVYEYDTENVKHVPCVAEVNTASVAISDNNKGVNLLDNKVYVSLPYNKSYQIRIDGHFELHDLKYRIIRIDKTQVVNDKGIISITGELVGKDVET